MSSIAQPVSPISSESKDPFSAKNLIWRSVSLDVIAWLEPDGDIHEQHLARQVHRQLLGSLRRAAVPKENDGKPSSRDDVRFSMELSRIRTHLIPDINACTFEVLEKASRSIVQVSSADVNYNVRLSEDSVIGEDDFCFKFKEIPFIGSPVDALQNMLDLRNESSSAQWRAFEFLIAIQDLRDATMALGLAETYRLTEVTWCKRKLCEAQKKVEFLKSKVRCELQSLISDTYASYQFHSPGVFPIALALPDTAGEDDFLLISSAYDNMALELHEPLPWVISGLPGVCRQAKKAWQEYLACGVAFRVVAAWLRAIGNLNRDAKRCQYCYRHRATKLRCSEHGSPLNQSPEARRGRAISPYYAQGSVELSKKHTVRKALNSSLIVHTEQWKSVLAEVLAERIKPEHAMSMTASYAHWGPAPTRVRVTRIPTALHRSTAILVVQLRSIRAVLGCTFQDEARRLFSEMVVVASAALCTKHHVDEFAIQRGREARYLLTLTNFLKLWFGRLGQTFSPHFPMLKSRGYDPRHSVVINGSASNSDVAIDFLLQRAWYDAELQFKNDTTIDRQRIIQLRSGPNPLSLRDIGKIVGCSYETVRRLLSSESPRKYQKLRIRG